jgi:hypothetical protein
MKKASFAGAVIALALLLIFAMGRTVSNYSQSGKSGFTITQNGYEYDEAGAKSLTWTRVRYYRPDGNFLEVTTPTKGAKTIAWSENGRYYKWSHRQKNPRILDVGPYDPQVAAEGSANLSSAQDRTGEATIHGLHVWLFRTEGVNLTTESAVSSDAWGFSLAQKRYQAGRLIFEIETMSVSRGTPDAAVWQAIRAEVPTGLQVVTEN